MDYERNKKYFNTDLGAGCFIIVFGLIVGMSGMLPLLLGITSNSNGLISVGFFICCVSLPIMFLGSETMKNEDKNKITDEMYDKAVISYSNKLIDKKAYEKLGIDKDEVNEAEPIYIGGYEFKNVNLIKKGKDNLFRSNLYKIIAIYFSKNEVHCYTWAFNTVCEKQEESTDVYFYDDIVSISTSSVCENIQTYNMEYDSFLLTTKGGTQLSVTIRNKEEAQRSINAMRSLLREKKQEK